MAALVPQFLLATACGLAAFATWTDVKKSEIPLFLPWAVLALAAVSWAISPHWNERAAISGTVAACAVVSLLFFQGSLNAAYAKTLFAYGVFFGSFGQSTRFLEGFIASFVAVTAVRACVFYVRLLASKTGRSVLSKHWKDGFRRKKDGSCLGTSVLTAVAYVLTVKAVFGIASNYGILKTGNSLLWIIGFLAVFPYAMKALEAVFPKNSRAQVSASSAAAILATGADMATGTSNSVHALIVSLGFWLAMSAILLGVTRFVRFYLEASNSTVVASADLKIGEVVDRDFFFARFLSGKKDGIGKKSGGFPFPEGKTTESDIEILRDAVVRAKSQNPGLPDEIRILTHHPLAGYLFVAALAVSAASVWNP